MLISVTETEEACSAKYTPLLAIGLVNGLLREAREGRLSTWERLTESLSMLGAPRENTAIGSYLLTGLAFSSIYGDKETLLKCAPSSGQKVSTKWSNSWTVDGSSFVRAV
jgi:hypothetical protein